MSSNLTSSAMKPNLTDEDVDTATSYADGAYRLLDKYKCSMPELKDALLDHSVEQCPSCKWFAESWEMLPLDSECPDGRCCNCRIEIQ